MLYSRHGNVGESGTRSVDNFKVNCLIAGNLCIYLYAGPSLGRFQTHRRQRNRYGMLCRVGLYINIYKNYKYLGDAIKKSDVIQNPISASIVGMVITLILQSSSTLISVLVGMVAGGCMF